MENEKIYNEIGKLIKEERKKQGITQEKLANLTCYSYSFIANIESNTYQSFSIHALYNIANALNISVHKLIPEKQEIITENYQLICKSCNYNVDISKEIGKILIYVEKLTEAKGKSTCPRCNRKAMIIEKK